MTTIAPLVDTRGTIEPSLDDLIDRIVERVIVRLQADQKAHAMRVREEQIHALRAWEDMYGLPRAIVPKREREGT